MTADDKFEALMLAEIHTLNELFAMHFTIVDTPKGTWRSVGGNPYEKIMNELKNTYAECEESD